MDEGTHPETSDSDGLDTTVSLDVIPLHSTNLLTVLNPEGIVQYESPSITRILGFDQEDLIGEQVAAFFHPEDRDDVLGAFESVVAASEYAETSVEYRHERADGSYRWVESVAAANPTPDGNYVVNTRNIEDRRRREQSLKRSNERLDEFAHVVSHDLRNPLGVARGHLEFAKEDCDSVHLDRIEHAHDRMESLIDELLSLAQAGEVIESLEPVNVARVASECWETIETGHASMNPDLDGSIRASRSGLQQLLENLMRNAVEHGGDAVTVTVGELDTGSGFFVEDDGSGIEVDQVSSVFESGFSTSSEGTGYGLTIVQEIAAAHDWEIALTEEDSGGVRFEFHDVEFK